MITRLIIENFKGFERIDVPLGPLNVLIGPNASGKSNFLEALRVLQGLAMGLPLGQILDDRTDDDRSTGFPGVRGGAAHAVRKSAGTIFALEVHWTSATVEHTQPAAAQVTRHLIDHFRYRVAVNCDKLRIDEECLWHRRDGQAETILQQRIVDLTDDSRIDDALTSPSKARVPIDQSILLRIFNEADGILVAIALRQLAEQTHLDPRPRVLRRYARLKDRIVLGDDGEYFAAVVDGIVRNPEAKQVFLSWLGTLRPEEISDVAALPGADPKHRLFALKEARASHEAWTYAASLSDGTLRFAAILAACLQARPPALLAIEEADTGIHPERLRVLVNLLRSRSDRMQIIATTHAPRLLDWLKSEELNHALWFRRARGVTEVLALGQSERLMDLFRQGILPGELLADGWMESEL